MSFIIFHYSDLVYLARHPTFLAQITYSVFSATCKLFFSKYYDNCWQQESQFENLLLEKQPYLANRTKII